MPPSTHYVRVYFRIIVALIAVQVAHTSRYVACINVFRTVITTIIYDGRSEMSVIALPHKLVGFLSVYLKDTRSGNDAITSRYISLHRAAMKSKSHIISTT